MIMLDKREFKTMEQKKQKIFYIVLSLVAVVVSIISIIIHFVPTNKTLTATDIYNKCLNNVVEVKAESDDIGESYGTGEIISFDGRIVTNAHVVTYSRFGLAHEFDHYYIRFAYENDYRSVKLEKFDNELDLAVLILDEITEISLQPLKPGDSKSIKPGDRIYAIGNASNYGIGIFEGIISIPLIYIDLDNITRTVIQCDLTIAAGNSGGALLDENGELIGITTFRTKDTSGNIIYGIVYCIPIDIVLNYINNKA